MMGVFVRGGDLLLLLVDGGEGEKGIFVHARRVCIAYTIGSLSRP